MALPRLIGLVVLVLLGTAWAVTSYLRVAEARAAERWVGPPSVVAAPMVVVTEAPAPDAPCEALVDAAVPPPPAEG